eukprot:scaffold1_cov402-Prasinococcus_capsulatus_cf.AAC.44
MSARMWIAAMQRATCLSSRSSWRSGSGTAAWPQHCHGTQMLDAAGGALTAWLPGAGAAAGPTRCTRWHSWQGLCWPCLSFQASPSSCKLRQRLK